MNTTDKDEQHMIRLRKRAEMQPSDDEEEEEEGSLGDDGRGSVEVSSGGEASNNSSGDEWEEEEEHGEGPNARRQGTPDHTSDAIDGDQALAIGKRLEMLAHGAGPSRRRNHLRHVKHLQPAAGKEGHKPALNRTTNSAISTTNTRSAAVWKPQDKKRLRAAASEAGEGGESSAAGVGRRKVHSRANKNRPQEVSSSRAVGRFREVVAGNRKASRDPRFEGGGGSSKLNYDIFRKAYGFLGAYQDSEIEELKKSLKKEKNQERSGRLQVLLTRLQQERAERSQGDRRRTAIREAKKTEREAVADGKKPYYLKASEKKRLSLEQRYQGLKEEGKLNKFMEKKRKKNAAKDHRWLPATRQDRG